jgi:hypothetical protein
MVYEKQFSFDYFDGKNTKSIKDLDKKVTGTQPIIEGFDGLMARINALNKLPFPSLFIMLLFLAIETSPIIAKLLSQENTISN